MWDATPQDSKLFALWHGAISATYMELLGIMSVHHMPPVSTALYCIWGNVLDCGSGSVFAATGTIASKIQPYVYPNDMKS